MNEEKLQQLNIDSQSKRRTQRPFWSILIGVAVVIAVALYYWWPRESDKLRVMKGKNLVGSSEHKKPSANSTNPNTSAVSSSTNPAQVDGSVLTVSGYIINRERIELSPRFLGTVKWIGVKKGDSVTNGQVVVLLDNSEYAARLKEVEGRISIAKVAIQKAELDYARTSKLQKENIESKQLEDDARLRVDSALAMLKEVEGAKSLIETYIDWCVIRSPINGVVLEKLVDPNELVVPQSFGGGRGPSTALIALADPKDLQVEIDLNESDLSKVFLKQKCRVSPEAYPEKSYNGFVAEIAPEATRAKGTLQVKVQIQKPDKYLTPELSARVDFIGRGSAED
ncbi:MAG: efflux RND transporter periplasmic adaptor subunit [Verrucomicrobiota bacterium]